MHKLLERQLRRHIGTEALTTPGQRALLDAIDEAYRAHDDDRDLLERSIELASSELVERNSQLERELAEVRRLELELRQAEKLRAVGQLAAGIAHEINTPVQFAGDSVHFLRGAFDDIVELVERADALCAAFDTGADVGAQLEAYKAAAEDADTGYLCEEVPKALTQATEGLKRVALIVGAMKEFGRPDQREKALLDINRCVRTTLVVANNELKYVADVALALGELTPIPCHPGELSQVLVNLLVNAAHAVSDRFGDEKRGRIEVKTNQDSEGVVISISDNGNGISEEHRARIFEPFFTTKALGRGTGQGLAISRSIVVEKHGGSLTFETEVGSGTTFYLKLPNSEREEIPASFHAAFRA